MSKNTFLSSFVIEVGYGNLTVQISSEQSDIFQTTGRQREFGPNYKWVYCNYPKKLDKLFLNRHKVLSSDNK